MKEFQQRARFHPVYLFRPMLPKIFGVILSLAAISSCTAMLERSANSARISAMQPIIDEIDNYNQVTGSYPLTLEAISTTDGGERLELTRDPYTGREHFEVRVDGDILRVIYLIHKPRTPESSGGYSLSFRMAAPGLRFCVWTSARRSWECGAPVDYRSF